ncbi:MAG: hypothetical protein A2X51_11590 [Candidatus Rokubacteria bacterium GWC2_70_24]|nr:MAG: hypothetical protein A2X53_11395 [Candidatus Rokubacteria bacterium GWA2_70_23]OGK86112.1 MAG: hypothetical protein A2X51_11590 [Candidatus Rokubacteria bacterium GWC2_70_24]
MKTRLWIVLLVVVAWTSFLIGYSVSALTGMKRPAAERPAAEASGTGGYSGAGERARAGAGGYGGSAEEGKPRARAGAGGYGRSEDEPKPRARAGAGGYGRKTE